MTQVEAKNMRVFFMTASGEQVEIHPQALSFESLRVTDDFIEMPTKFPAFHAVINHITRRQLKMWLRLSGLPSGRRSARRARKRRGEL